MQDQPQKYFPVHGNFYSITGSELGLVILVQSACTIVLSSVFEGFWCYVRRIGGPVTFQAASGQTILSDSNLLSIAAQFVTVGIDHQSPTQWSLNGGLV